MRKQKKIIASFALLTLFALSLRFFHLSKQSFWTDEVSSVTTARAPYTKLVELSASLNNSPPTFFLLLRPLVSGSDKNIELRARCLSALAGGLSVPLLVLVIFLWRRSWPIAFFGGMLLAVNPLHLWYSQE